MRTKAHRNHGPKSGDFRRAIAPMSTNGSRTVPQTRTTNWVSAPVRPTSRLATMAEAPWASQVWNDGAAVIESHSACDRIQRAEPLELVGEFEPMVASCRVRHVTLFTRKLIAARLPASNG